MNEKKDFYNNNLLELVDYWKTNEDTLSNSLKKTAETFSIIYKNNENRLNREQALKEMGMNILSSGQNYKSIINFDTEIKPLFDEFDKIDDSGNIKRYLTNMKKAFCFYNFKKTAETDLNNLSNNKLNKFQINSIVESVILLKDQILKDETSKSIVERMLKIPSFKKEYDIAKENDNNISNIKKHLHNNNFLETLEDFGRFYNVSSITKIPSGNDPLSVEYRNDIMPKIDKFSRLLDTINLSEDKYKDIYSLKFNDEEINKIKDLKDILFEYNLNKEKYYSNKNSENNLDSKSKEIELDSSLSKHYDSDIKYIENAYSSITNRQDSNYTEDKRLKDLLNLKKFTESIPENEINTNDLMIITNIKRSINNNDLILLDGYHNSNKRIEILKKEDLITKFKNDEFESSLDKRLFQQHLIEITKNVDNIFNKYGIQGLPSFNEKEQLKFIELKTLSDNYKKIEKQENLLKLDI